VWRHPAALLRISAGRGLVAFACIAFTYCIITWAIWSPDIGF
jgi:hypothetical protein